MDKPTIDRELLESLVEFSNDGIVVAEQEGDDHILIYVNKAFEELTGYTADEILYQDCRFLQMDDRDQSGLRRIRDALKVPEACRVRIRNYRKDGSMFWNELSMAPYFNQKDKLTYFIGVQKDVTQEVEQEQRIAELEQQLAGNSAS